MIIVMFYLLSNFLCLLVGLSDDNIVPIPVIDGHNDLPDVLYTKVGYNIDKFDFTRNLTNDPYWGLHVCSTCHTDLPRLRQGNVIAQFWVAYVNCSSQYKDAVEQTLDRIDIINRLIQKYPNDLKLAKSVEGIVNAYKQGKIASLIAVEGGHSIDSRMSILRLYYKLGVRYMTLTHSCSTPWADASPVDADSSLFKHNGLTEWGKKVVIEMNRLGMMVDISHVAQSVMSDVLNISKAPVIFSHSSAYSINPHHRNVPDDILKRLKHNDGIIMVNFYSVFLSSNADKENANLSTVADHINHIVNITGFDHIGLGSDFNGVDKTPIGLEDVSTYQNIFKFLHKQNPEKWNVKNLEKLGYKNFLRVFSKVEEVKNNLQYLEADSSELPHHYWNDEFKKCRTD